MRLNIGAGSKYMDGYINLDIDSIYKVDVLGDAVILPFKDCMFNEVYSRAVLEHFSWRNTFEILWEWRRVLKFGGKLVIMVPNWFWLRKQDKIAYEIAPWLLGAHRDKYDYHKALFDKPTLLMFFKQIGMNDIQIENQGFYINVEGMK